MHVSRRIQPVLAALVAAALTFVLAVVVPFSPASRTDAAAQTLPGVVSGVDVAGHQRPGGRQIDWRTVAGPGGQRFAFVKASEGEGWKNEFYDEDARAAADAGMKVGAYHYARPAEDPVTQAQYFASVINAGPALSLPPVLDVEVDEGLSPQALIGWTQVFLSEVEQATGTKPMLYTYRYFWTERMANTNAFTGYPLWLAAYQNQAPRPVGGWDKLTFWQRSDSGRVPGMNTPVDMNVFNGSEADLSSFSAGNYAVGGGVLESFQVPESGELGILEQDNTALVVAILGLATGILGSPQVHDAAAKFGFNPEDADKIAANVKDLAAQGQLPVGDLRTMMLGDYSVGDLLILLANAQK
ncbi:glycoside hydrolase family 25 protein [Corynebacterium liangguodongii]|uniref:Hydrolase n=1 Tax=Corynebacterium liangguodongii TaxID=2079535 RepID=A0A2S0WGZ6_9CORY|nr:glycoside hydrolase family 25 protein [Corynebacterium liangguodongii]AWB85049.1 hydrolase [Corynebacterium liangguodongii]PWB98998.1 hydrolase [Corynebacterium liangguodongii]